VGIRLGDQGEEECSGLRRWLGWQGCTAKSISTPKLHCSEIEDSGVKGVAQEMELENLLM
jgi:hypothetical protein